MADKTVTPAQLTALYTIINHKSGLDRYTELNKWMAEVSP